MLNSTVLQHNKNNAVTITNDQKSKERERIEVTKEHDSMIYLFWLLYSALFFVRDITRMNECKQRKENYKRMFEKRFYCALKNWCTGYISIFSPFFLFVSKRSMKTKKPGDNTLFICLFVYLFVFFGLNVSIDFDFRNKRFKMLFFLSFFCVILSIQLNENVFIYDVVRSMIDDNYKIAWMATKKTKIVWAESCPNPLSAHGWSLFVCLLHRFDAMKSHEIKFSSVMSLFS